MKNFFKIPTITVKQSWVMLFLRIVVGIGFMIHGWGKIQNPFGWMGPDSSMPGFIQFLVALSEFGGGLALILGLLTNLAVLGMGTTMLGAIYTHAVVFGDPFVSKGGGSYELATLYFVIFCVVYIFGPGCLSLDHKLFGTRK